MTQQQFDDGYKQIIMGEPIKVHPFLIHDIKLSTLVNTFFSVYIPLNFLSFK